jgi:hypothetical protein
VDYNSDCEFLNEAEKRDQHSRGSDTRCAKTDSSSHMTVNEMTPVQVQSSSAQVLDNWETLQVRTCSSHLLYALLSASDVRLSFHLFLLGPFCHVLLRFLVCFVLVSLSLSRYLILLPVDVRN